MIGAAAGKACVGQITRTAWGWLHVRHQRESCGAAAGTLITGCAVRVCSVDVADSPSPPKPATLFPGVMWLGDFGFRPRGKRLLEGRAL